MPLILGKLGRDHPFRASLSEEMESRSWPDFSAPSNLVQIVTTYGQRAEDGHIAFVNTLLGVQPSALIAGARFFTCRFLDCDFVWERHTEFLTYTFIKTTAPQTYFDLSPFLDILGALGTLPGEIVRASHICFRNSTAIAAPGAQPLDFFSANNLVVCDVAEGRGRIWTDFRLHDDGFGRMLVADQGLLASEATQVIQALQELGNYRKMALLGLPLARDLMPDISELERNLARLTRDISQEGVNEHDWLLKLTALSAEVACRIAETQYRMSASRAYSDICLDRVRQLSIRSVAAHPSLADFTERRLLPAVRTCNALSDRLEALSRHASWASALLRTRIDTSLARQNVTLLGSMNRRTNFQLRLQQAVEVLSIAAVTYYVTGLIHYLVKPITVNGHEYADLIAGACLLPVALAVWARFRVLRRRHESRSETDSSI